ncbi:hypothetical protein E2C01_085224 [Portunus trituberculatus]|uniref:Uncharacterized protein n=1 Tax=Portunus trituberculatus TaxID=210409 RepID=A0A5B7JBC4_PORTR|nr:hypothetical protein [Portunus trituberculatus]
MESVVSEATGTSGGGGGGVLEWQTTQGKLYPASRTLREDNMRHDETQHDKTRRRDGNTRTKYANTNSTQNQHQGDIQTDIHVTDGSCSATHASPRRHTIVTPARWTQAEWRSQEDVPPNKQHFPESRFFVTTQAERSHLHLN